MWLAKHVDNYPRNKQSFVTNFLKAILCKSNCTLQKYCENCNRFTKVLVLYKCFVKNTDTLPKCWQQSSISTKLLVSEILIKQKVDNKFLVTSKTYFIDTSICIYHWHGDKSVYLHLRGVRSTVIVYCLFLLRVQKAGPSGHGSRIALWIAHFVLSSVNIIFVILDQRTIGKIYKLK